MNSFICCKLCFCDQKLPGVLSYLCEEGSLARIRSHVEGLHGLVHPYPQSTKKALPVKACSTGSTLSPHAGHLAPFNAENQGRRVFSHTCF